MVVGQGGLPLWSEVVTLTICRRVSDMLRGVCIGFMGKA